MTVTDGTRATLQRILSHRDLRRVLAAYLAFAAAEYRTRVAILHRPICADGDSAARAATGVAVRSSQYRFGDESLVDQTQKRRSPVDSGR